MSYAKLLHATKDFLIENISFDDKKLDENSCDVTVDGRPPTNSGEIFVAVHASTFRGNNLEILDAIYGLNVTVTFRCAKTPFDRLGMKVIVDQSLGLGEFVHTLVESIGMNYHILHIANSRMDVTKNRWVEPLRFMSSSAPRLVGGEWFHAASREAQEEALVQSISFGEARRVQFYTYQPYPENFDGLINGDAIRDKYNLPPNLVGDFLQPNV